MIYGAGTVSGSNLFGAFVGVAPASLEGSEAGRDYMCRTYGIGCLPDEPTAETIEMATNVAVEQVKQAGRDLLTTLENVLKAGVQGAVEGVRGTSAGASAGSSVGRYSTSSLVLFAVIFLIIILLLRK